MSCGNEIRISNQLINYRTASDSNIKKISMINAKQKLMNRIMHILLQLHKYSKKKHTN